MITQMTQAKKWFATIFGILITLLVLSLSIGSTPTTAKGGNNFNNVRVDPEGAAVGQEDPTIVAHPTEADTLYVAWEDKGDNDIYFSRSTDGGRAWEAARRVADDSGSSSRYDPTLAIGANGTLYLAWQDNRTPSGIYFAKSTDGGMTWSANQKVDSTDSFGSEAALAVGADGTLYLAWLDYGNENDIYVAHSTDDGQNWSTPQSVNSDVSFWNSSLTIAPGAAGTVYVAWIDSRNGNSEIYFAYSTDRGQTFSANQKINDDTDSSDRYGVDLVADGNGAVYIAWRNWRGSSRAIYLARSSDSGQNWEPNQEIHTSRYQYGLSLALKADGTVLMAWNNLGELPMKNGIYFATSTDAGQTWEISDGLGLLVEDDYNDTLVLTVGANGRYYIVYGDDDDDGRSINRNIYLARSTDGQFWSEYQVNDESGKGAQREPTVALDPAGTVYVMWRDQRTVAGNSSYFARSTNNGQTWSAASPINEGQADALAFDSAGTLYVAWLETSSDNRGLYLASSTDQGTTFGEGVLINNQVGGTTASYPSLIVGTDNTLYVVWTDHLSGQNVYFAYSTDGGQSFSTVKVNDEASQVASRAVMGMDSSGALYVAWTDQRQQSWDIYFARSTDGGQTWSADLKMNDHAGSASQNHPTLAVDSNGTLYLAWRDTRNTPIGELYFSRSLDGGLNWSANANLADGVGFNSNWWFQSLAIAPSGTLYLMARASIQDQDHSVYLTRSTNGGESWEEPLGINQKENLNLSGISMAIGSDETLALAWADELYGAYNVFFAQGQYSSGENPTPAPSTYQLYLPSVMR